MRSAFYSKNPIKNLKYCIQRIKRGYCDADLWAIDEWFLAVIVPMLRQFNDTRTGGCPRRLQGRFIADIKDKADSDKLYEIGNRKWSDALNRLANDFETLHDLSLKNAD